MQAMARILVVEDDRVTAALIFDQYRRGSASKPTEGMGLGLFIVKALVGAHGGRVAVESTPGQGSRFAVMLPVG